MSETTVQIERLKEYSSKAAAGMGALYPVLYPEHGGKPVDRELLEAMIKSDTSQVLLAYLESEIVGMAILNVIRTGTRTKVHLDDFIVNPDAQGHGVGRKLWDEMIVWAREKGAVKITLVSSMPKAIEFYLHRGAEKRPDVYFSLPLD